MVEQRYGSRNGELRAHISASTKLGGEPAMAKLGE